MSTQGKQETIDRQPPDTADARPDDLPAHRLPTRQCVFRTLLAIMLWNIGTWAFVSYHTEANVQSAISRAGQTLQANLNDIAEGLRRNLAVLHGIPAVVGRNPAIIDALQRNTVASELTTLPRAIRRDRLQAMPELAALNHLLRQAIDDTRAMSVVWIMDRDGNTIASSNAGDDESFVGTRYADRIYFREAIAGRQGQQFALGRRTNIPGLYFSAPVKQGDRVVGVVAGKIDLPFLAYWVNQSNAFITDSFDVIIMAQDRSLEMRALPKGRYAMLTAGQRQARYKRDTFDELRMAPWKDRRFSSLLTVDNGAMPMLIGQRAIEGEEVTVTVLAPVPEAAALTDTLATQVLAIGLLGSALIVVIAGGLYYTANLQHLHRYRRHQQQIEYLATHDALTGLFSRSVLDRMIAQGIAMAQRSRMRFAVVYVDLDYFKDINDSLGHEVGDAVLKIVAERLCCASRDSDTVVRQGGDEFVMLLNGITCPQDVTPIAMKILALLRQPLLLAETELRLAASVGIALYPDDGATASLLLRHADLALYRAKKGGRNDFCFYHPQLQSDALGRLSLEQELRSAIEHGEFRLHFQPQFSLARDAVIGCEALLRWQHPARGLLAAADFIPAAERSGLIVPIGQWVLNEACRQARRWRDALGRELPVAVNVSLAQLRSRDFVADAEAALEGAGLPARCLELELTEAVLMTDSAELRDTLQALVALGVRIAVDDFGAGLSSLAKLKAFNADTLKIDRSFVHGLDRSRADGDAGGVGDGRAIVSAIVGLSHSLDFRVIAEGAETEAQVADLQALGCDRIQGFWLCKPMTTDDCLPFLMTATARPASTPATKPGNPAPPARPAAAAQ